MATVTSSGAWVDPPVPSYAQAPTACSIEKNTEISKCAFVSPPLWDRKAAQSYGISSCVVDDRTRTVKAGAPMPLSALSLSNVDQPSKPARHHTSGQFIAATARHAAVSIRPKGEHHVPTNDPAASHWCSRFHLLHRRRCAGGP